MKSALLSLLASLALIVAAHAETSVKLTNVHLCCGKCVKGVEGAVAKVPGVTPAVDKDAGTVTLTGADAATVQKAVNAIVGAGYYATSSDPAIKIHHKSGATDAKVQSLKVTGVHLCCDKCVKAVNAAVTGVSGVKATTAEKGAHEFEITGDFSGKEVFAALEKAGFSGKVGQ